MVKVVGPMMSLQASGTIGNTLTFAEWKGRPYVRQRVIPTNPNSAAQQGVRSMLKFLADQWSIISALDKATYTTAAEGRNISEYNQYISENLSRWQTFNTPAQASPPAEASTPLTVSTMTLTGGVKSITVELTPSAATDIWGFVLMRDTAEITAPAWNLVIAVLPADGANKITHVDAPLPAGTYHYRAAVFNDDGVCGTYIADDSETATAS